MDIITATTSSSTIDAAVHDVASRLGPHVERIDVSYLLPRNSFTDPLTRGTLQCPATDWSLCAGPVNSTAISGAR